MYLVMPPEVKKINIPYARPNWPLFLAKVKCWAQKECHPKKAQNFRPWCPLLSSPPLIEQLNPAILWKYFHYFCFVCFLCLCSYLFVIYSFIYVFMHSFLYMSVFFAKCLKKGRSMSVFFVCQMPQIGDTILYFFCFPDASIGAENWARMCRILCVLV